MAKRNVRNVKIGPAFYDFMSQEKTTKRGNYGNSFVMSGIVHLFPLFLLILLFLILATRLFYVQVLRAGYYKDLSDSNRTRTQVIEAPRGIIYDRNGKPLVANSATFSVKKNGKEQEINQEEALKIISQNGKVDNTIRRDYLYKSAFAHVLGYVGTLSEDESHMPEFKDYSINDNVGKIGLENEYESLLHGVNGKKLYEVDAQGNYIRELGTNEPIPGQNLKTTLDLNLQLAAKEAMKNINKGAVVVSNVNDGGIMALYSKPSFDPNLFTHGGSKTYKPDGDYTDPVKIVTDSDKRPLLDRAIGGVFPPGSTFKLVAATAALEKGSIKKDTIIEDTGILKVGNFSFGNWYFLQYGRKEGDLDIVGAIKRSNDIFFYKSAESTGVDNISAWAKKFGMGERLGIDLPGELSGTVPTVEWKEKTIGEQWYLGDTYNYGIGQGYLLATPLQVNMMTDVFANRGTLYKPHLLEGQSKVLKKDFIKKENLDLVTQGMEEACETGGVAWPLFDFKVKNPKLKIDNTDYFKDASAGADMVRVKMGCKTGTAETGDKDTNPHAWITVFAPFSKPEIAVTVLVENGGEGSSIAGPVARDVLKAYFEKKNN
ncbi:MAG TPA: penicillin-binding transpeptidase domain-containing protein [Patescibacteria group bacterium]|nr:penicillin-binding transpeptidase domain-containing protein [Patescibacteria group bacterium]